jgi:hypothetical protein
MYAYEQNLKNIEYLQKVKMVVNLKVINFNLYRFQKIKVKFYKLHELDANEKTVNFTQQDIDNPSFVSKDYDADKINNRLTGEWLITAINYTFNKIGGFSQEVTMVKRELGFNKEDFKNK